jgi:hypothetical protein
VPYLSVCEAADITERYNRVPLRLGDPKIIQNSIHRGRFSASF